MAGQAARSGQPGRLCALAAALVLPGWQCATAETLFSVYGGTSFTRDSDLRLSQPGAGTDLTLRDVRWDAEAFKPAPYYGLRASHFFDSRPEWGVALDFTHYKMIAQTDRTVVAGGAWKGAAVDASVPMDRYVQHFEISHGVNMLSLNALYRWLGLAWLDGRLQPYAGAGLAWYFPHSENTVDGRGHETGYMSSGIGYQVLGGVQYRISERWGLFGELKFNSGTAKVDIADGQAETRLRTFHALAGVQLVF